MPQAPTSPQEIFAPTAEQESKNERLTQAQLRRAVAEAAFLLILIATYEKSHAAKEATSQFELRDRALSNEALKFGLLNNAFAPKGGRSNIRVNVRLAGFKFSPKPHNNFNPEYDGILANMGGPTPTYTPAPSMGDVAEGPQLPNLAFNDRIRPVGKQPSEADFAAATRANEMYQGALWGAGWRGGEASPDEQKSAGRAMARAAHPDLLTTTAEDAAAYKAFNSQKARPTTPTPPSDPAS